jgi:HSP90 family molecular chaperone
VERLLKKGYEVLYLTEAVDEYCISAVPEFDGKKFQNVAKEGFSISEGDKAKEKFENLKKHFEPLTKWLNDEALKDQVSQRNYTILLAISELRTFALLLPSFLPTCPCIFIFILLYF